jgi:hypothetical protein
VGFDQQILAIVSSHAVNEIHRCLVLWSEDQQRRVGDIRHIGDWADGNPMWRRLS